MTKQQTNQLQALFNRVQELESQLSKAQQTQPHDKSADLHRVICGKLTRSKADGFKFSLYNKELIAEDEHGQRYKIEIRGPLQRIRRREKARA